MLNVPKTKSVSHFDFLWALVAMLALATSAQTTFADEWNVRDFGAVGDGVADDTVSIQRAIDAAGAAGGGVVYIPAGKYRLSRQSSEYEGLLILDYPAVELRGDATNTRPDTSFSGSVLFADTKSSTRSILLITKTSRSPFPHDLAIRHLKLTRQSPDESLSGFDTSASVGGDGIVFAASSTLAQTYEIRGITIESVAITKQNVGIRCEYVNGSQFRIEPTLVAIKNSVVTNNKSHGLHLMAWGGLQFNDSDFSLNGQSGIVIETFFRDRGTLFFKGISAANNGYAPARAGDPLVALGGYGVICKGHPRVVTEGPLCAGPTPYCESNNQFVPDVMMTCCQFDANFRSGLRLESVKNASIVGCEISANGSGIEAHPGCLVYQSKRVNMSGCSLLDNAFEGISLIESVDVVLSGLALVANTVKSNSLPFTQMTPSVRILSSQNVSGSGLTFSGVSHESEQFTVGLFVGGCFSNIHFAGCAFNLHTNGRPVWLEPTTPCAGPSAAIVFLNPQNRKQSIADIDPSTNLPSVRDFR
ncbi:MAG: right-handed parallel beta-helix repeat-containing protein [Phycisphaerales bacterium]|nr:right-handed parallel beta-helix repeat-containing protein [Phycisphaerales bacterium]